jgi:hypothetical protein
MLLRECCVSLGSICMRGREREKWIVRGLLHTFLLPAGVEMASLRRVCVCVFGCERARTIACCQVRKKDISACFKEVVGLMKDKGGKHVDEAVVAAAAPTAQHPADYMRRFTSGDSPARLCGGEGMGVSGLVNWCWAWLGAHKYISNTTHIRWHNI